MARGGKRPGAGRPTGTFKKDKLTCRTIQKHFRLKETELSEIEEAAEIQQKDFKKFVKDAALSAADRILKREGS